MSWKIYGRYDTDWHGTPPDDEAEIYDDADVRYEQEMLDKYEQAKLEEYGTE